MSLSTEAIRDLLKLSLERDKIAEKLTTLEQQIEAKTAKVESLRNRRGAKLLVVKTSGLPGKLAKRGKQRDLKSAILGALEKAGAAGVSVKELSKNLGIKNQHVHVWFGTTGKKVEGLVKEGRGLWKLVTAPITKAIEGPTQSAKPGKKTKKAKTLKPKKQDVKHTFNGGGPPAKGANLVKAAKMAPAKKKPAKKSKK